MPTLSFVTFTGAMAKLKYVSIPVLSNTGFLSGDYVAAGVGAGLSGNASGKELGGPTVGSLFAGYSGFGVGVYRTSAPSSSGIEFGCAGTIGDRIQLTAPAAGRTDFYLGGPRVSDLTLENGCYICFDDSGTVRMYRNGAEEDNDTPIAGTFSNISGNAFRILANNATLAASFLVLGFTTADAVAFTNRLETLMDSIGAGVIP